MMHISMRFLLPYHYFEQSWKSLTEWNMNGNELITSINSVDQQCGFPIIDFTSMNYTDSQRGFVTKVCMARVHSCN